MAKNSVKIRKAESNDTDAILEIMQPIIRTGDSYVYDPSMSKKEAIAIWLDPKVNTFVAVHNSEILGTYIIKQNFPGLGSHVANCSYMVSNKAQGQGIGKLMGEHSIAVAKKSGFLAMQFNIVVSTNVAAIKLWKSLGFAIIGTSPKAFKHQTLGFVDTYIMHNEL